MSSSVSVRAATATPAEMARALRDARTAVVCGHVDPDGDALGSLLALTAALRAVGVDAQPSWGGRDDRTPPAAVEPGWDFLPLLDAVRDPEAVHAEPDVVVCCDTAAASRLGTLHPVLERAGTVAVIDHHDVGTPFGDLRLVDGGASSTGILVLQVIDALGVRLSRPIADALYLAILTDTGRFGFSSTGPADHLAAARLLAAGADHEGIARAVYDSSSAGYLQLLATVCARATFAGDLVWSWTTQEDLLDSGAEPHETDALIEPLRRVRSTDVALLLRRTATGAWRGSLRSRGRTDVARIAGALGGGGHRLAAGFGARGSADEIADQVRGLLDGGPA